MRTQLLIMKEKNLIETSPEFYLDALFNKIKSFLEWINDISNQSCSNKKAFNKFLRLIKDHSSFKAASLKDFFDTIETNFYDINDEKKYDLSIDDFNKLNDEMENLSKDDLNKLNNKKQENFINCLNFYIEFLFEIISDSDFKFISFDNKYIVFVEDFNEMIKIIEFYPYKFDSNIKNIVPTEHFFLLENIFVEPLNKIVYKYKSSINLEDKESIFADLAKRMLHILEQNSVYRKVLKKYFTDDFLDHHKKECNAYFRHASSDLKNHKLTETWVEFTAYEKIDIMNKTLNVYLFILSVLRTENLLERFEDSFNK